MKLSELLRRNERPQAFGALTAGEAACAVAQVFEEAFGVPAARVGVRRESSLLEWVIRTYRIQVPARRERCRKCAAPFDLPHGLSGYIIHLNDVHLAPKAVIAEALEELGL
jgi:hypothetical protein